MLQKTAGPLRNGTFYICSTNCGDTQSQRRKEEPQELRTRELRMRFAGSPLTSHCLLFRPLACSREVIRRGVSPCPCVTKGHKLGLESSSQKNLCRKNVMTNQQLQPELLFLPVSPPRLSETGLHQHFTLSCQDRLATGS